MSQHQAEAVKCRAEPLNAAGISKYALGGDTATWVAGIGDDQAAKVATVGLIAEPASTLLIDFFAG